MFPFEPLGSIRKPKVFKCFQGDQKETMEINCLIGFTEFFNTSMPGGNKRSYVLNLLTANVPMI